MAIAVAVRDIVVGLSLAKDNVLLVASGPDGLSSVALDALVAFVTGVRSVADALSILAVSGAGSWVALRHVLSLQVILVKVSEAVPHRVGLHRGDNVVVKAL